MLARISNNLPLVRSHQHTVAASARILLAVLLATLAAPLNADEGFPYRAVVETANASVQSGPGIEFYATDRLAKGTPVEVWRHDTDGWIAIRPPTNSFSWVLAEHLEMTDDPKLARVINAPVKTRIGSLFSDARDVEYISLRTGEVVELMGTKELEGPDDESQRWFKIAPPSGEFRWIHSDSVRRIKQHKRPAEREVAVGTESIRTFDLPSDPQSIADANGTATDEAHAVAEPNRLVIDNAFIEVDRITRSSEPATQTPLRDAAIRAASFEDTTASKPTSVADDRSDSAEAAAMERSHGVASKRSDDLAEHTGRAQTTDASFNTVTWEAVGDPTDVLGAPEPRSFQESHDALNLMLSRSVLGDIQSWDLSAVQRQSELLLAAARTLEEEALAESLLVKIEEFLALQKRSMQLAAGPDRAVGLTNHEVALTSHEEQLGSAEQLRPGYQPRTPSVGNGPGTVSSVAAAGPSLLPSFQPDDQLVGSVEMPRRIVKERPAAPADSAAVGTGLKRKGDIDNSIFDASGLLIAVQARRSDMPRYALTDSRGQITQFVSTPNRADLRRFLNKRVGVLGEVGYLRKLNKPYVAAQRIVLLRR